MWGSGDSCVRTSASALVTRGRGADVACEVAVQVGLVVQSNGCGDLGGPVTVEEKATRVFDSLSSEVGVWRKAVCLLEAADQVGGVGVQGGTELDRVMSGCSPDSARVASVVLVR